MAIPTCADNCDFELPPVKFNDCAPDVNYSEIRRIFIAGKNAQPFNNWLQPGEWMARISETATGPDAIRAFTVIGDKPAAASVVKEISNGRRITIGKDHTMNFTIDDVSQENYDFFRALECGGLFRYWYETEGGKMYGGNDGFVAQLDANNVLNRGRDEIETINGVLTWRAKFHPERGVSPIYNGSNGTPVPATFDTEILFAASATPASVAGVTAVAGATDAEQGFEFNAISPRTGGAQSMSIEVASTEELTVDFTADYVGSYFKYTDKAGVPHTGQFPAGVSSTVSF